MERYQTIGSRILALIVDTLVFIPFFTANYWIYLIESDVLHFGLVFVMTLIGIAYNVLMHWKYGQTVGKMVAKVKVLDALEGPITLRQAVIRDIFYVVYGLASLFLSMILVFFMGYTRTDESYQSSQLYWLIPMYLWLIVDSAVCVKNKKNMALHDLMAGTVVVRPDKPAEYTPELHPEPPSPDTYEDIGEARR